MKQNPSTSIFAAVALMGAAAAPVADAAITFNGGVADLTFFYNDDTEAFEVVFRTKGNTVASGPGLSDPYGEPPGGFGGSTSDFNFDQLQINVTQAPQVELNGRDYWVSPAAGNAYTNASDPDLGIRTRLREDDGFGGFVDQFDSFEMTLVGSESSGPVGWQFALFRTALDETVGIETAEGDFTAEFPNWGHSHWHFGFSDQGDYRLVFDVQGVGGKDGPSPLTRTALNFRVVPEPSTMLLSLVAVGGWFLRRRR